MPRDKHRTVRLLSERYGLPAHETARIIERRVIGAEFGANGYTTAAQARHLVKALRLGPGVRLLDIGAGRGWPGLYLSQISGCNTVMADVPLAGLRTAVATRDRLALAQLIEVCRASGTHPPFRSASFDAVVHTDTL